VKRRAKEKTFQFEGEKPIAGFDSFLLFVVSCP
jgi:hypothetical protein